MKKAQKNIIGLFLITGLCFSACDGSKAPVVQFSYQKILKKEYQLDVGKVVPVTIEQSIETDGVFSRDGLYFFYSSDRERENYDIFLRSLTDITTVRVTQHPSRDTAPAISPNGKYLAFVSQREDPNGDIYIMEIDPAKLIEKAKKSVISGRSVDADAVNLTQFQDPASKVIRIIKDNSPVWSPDGKRLAFSSDRNGKENIWIMDKSGKNMRQVSRRGGRYPRFSENGRSIIFISYRDEGSNGDVYAVNIQSGKETKITENNAIELSPGFMSNESEVIFTRIDTDTNGDGAVNLKDRSVIMYKNIKTGAQYPLTLRSESSFNPVWMPVFRPVFKGVIVYSDLRGQNININIIPDDGIIPKRKSALHQYNLAEKYLKEFDDRERYLLCLEREYHFFGNRGDLNSIIYVTKALVDAAGLYRDSGNIKQARIIKDRLLSLGKSRTDYRTIMGEYLNLVLARKAGDRVLKESLNQLKKDNPKNPLIPILMEDLGDEYRRTGKTGASLSQYKEILREYPKYERDIYLHSKIASLELDLFAGEISPSLIEVLNSKYVYIKNDIAVAFLDAFEREKNAEVRLELAGKLVDAYKDNKQLSGILNFLIGKAYFERKDYKKAVDHLRQSLKDVYRTDLIYYKSNFLLGTISEKQRKYDEMEKHFFDASFNYKLEWKQETVNDIIEKIIDYYEEYGEREESAGNYGQAIELYKKYVKLLTRLHLKKRFEDIYNRYASRAHVLYIDAYEQLKGDDFNELSNIRKEYEKRLNIARLDRDKAHIYGLGYIYSKMALSLEQSEKIKLVEKTGVRGLLEYFSKSIEQLEWAFFIDDTFIDPYILKGWIYQYVDLRRKEDQETTGGRKEGLFSKFFPRYLWESNIELYEKALEVNDESKNPLVEGNLHLNIANNYFLLTNYPRALLHYKQVQKLKGSFNSKREEALFHYHFGYCLWQDDQFGRAREEMGKTLFIYRTISAGTSANVYKKQILTIYRFFALFDRLEKNYKDAIDGFNRILEYASVNRIKIDRARYLQEIAWCYRELGQERTALAYLEKAGTILEKSEFKEKKYRLKAKLFGLGPIEFFDLGPDVAIIGDNRIYTELDKYNKLLLNISLQESIYFDLGDYQKSVQYLERKLKTIGKRKTKVDQETRIKTLINIGFNHFMLRNYGKTFHYYREAWEYARDKKVNNINGVFESIINIANLYAFLAENNISLKEVSGIDIKQLEKQISDFKNNYEKDRYEHELKIIKNRAAQEKRKVSDDELESLRAKIAREAALKYYIIDTALGVLKFYQAEVLYGSKYRNEASTLEGTYDLYSKEKNVFDLYTEAAEKFTSALPEAGKRKSKELLIKLLLNTALCQKRTGMLEEAYESLKLARTLSDDYQYRELQWSILYEMGLFLVEHGGSIEIGNNLSRAEDYFEKALSIIETCPQLFSSMLDRVGKLYDVSTALLVKRGKIKEAFTVAEKKYNSQLRIMIHTLSPAFRDDNEKEMYREFRKYISYIGSLYKRKSRLIEKGLQKSSKEYSDMSAEIEKAKENISNMMSTNRPSKSIFISYMAEPDIKLKAPKNSLILRFFSTGDRFYVWKLTEKGLFFKVLGDVQNSDGRFIKELKKFLSNVEKDRVRTFIVLDENSVKIFKRPEMSDLFTGYTFLPSAERIKYYDSFAEPVVSSVYSNKKGVANILKKAGFLKGIPVREGKIDKKDFPVFSIIIDDAMEPPDISPGFLFSNTMNAALLIKDMDAFDMSRLSLITEAALYSGIRSVIITKNANPENLSNLVKRYWQGRFREIVPKVSDRSINVLALGNQRASGKTAIHDIDELKKVSLMKYNEEYRNGNIDSAVIHLKRYKELAGNNKIEGARFSFHMALLSISGDKYGKAAKYAANALRNSAGAGDELYYKAISLNIYLNLLRGKIRKASELLTKHAIETGFTNSSDYGIYTSLYILSGGNNEKSISSYEKIKNRKALLPRRLMEFLYANFLNLCGEEKYALKILNSIKDDLPFSARELNLYSLVTRRTMGSNTVKSKRPVEIIRLINSNAKIADQKRRASLLLERNGVYDVLSPFPVSIILQKYILQNMLTEARAFLDSISIGDLARKALWMDGLSLLNSIQDMYITAGKYEDALNISGIIRNMLAHIDMPVLKRKNFLDRSTLYLKLRKIKKSYQEAQQGISITDVSNELYIRFKFNLIENEIWMGKHEQASRRIQSIGKKIPDKYRYVANLLKSRNELARIVKKGKANTVEFNSVRQMVLDALDLLDRSPEVLQQYPRIDLIEQNMDFLISFTMARGRYVDALLYEEIKKQLLIRSQFPRIARTGLFTEEVIKEFKGIKDNKGGSKRFMELLNSYPSLQVGAMISVLPVDEFQKKISEDAIVLYLIRNQNDIFTWVIGRKYIDPLRFRNGYLKAHEIQNKYYERIRGLKNITGLGKELENVFGSLKKYYKHKKVIIMITDRDLENVPFEIMGVKNLLGETYTIVHMPSILSGLRSYHNDDKIVSILGTDKNKVFQGIETVAIRQSGIPYKNTSNFSAGIAHVFSMLSYNPASREMYINKKNYRNVIKGGEILYLSNGDIAGFTGFNNLAVYNSVFGIRAVIVNNAEIQDINNALFIDKLYSNLNRKDDIILAFSLAKQHLQAHDKFKNPAYWAGIKLYLNGI